MATSLKNMTIPDLQCHAWRHRWELESSRAMRLDGQRCWDDLLRCTGCGSAKTELRWNNGQRVGPQPSYQLEARYHDGCGYTQAEYIQEIRRRGQHAIELDTKAG